MLESDDSLIDPARVRTCVLLGTLEPEVLDKYWLQSLPRRSDPDQNNKACCSIDLRN